MLTIRGLVAALTWAAWSAISGAPTVAPAVSAPGKVESPKAQESDCEQAGSPGALAACALTQHPKVKRALAELRSRRAALGLAGQRPNPDIEGRALRGGDSSSVEAAIVHTFETGGKRDARLGLARARIAEGKSTLELARQEVLLQVLDLLIQYKHANTEYAALSEAQGVYRRLVARLAGYPYLSPSNRAALAVFRTGVHKADLQLAALQQAQRTLLGRLRVIVGPRFAPDPDVLPPQNRATWPSVEVPAGEPAAIALGKARIELARAGVASEKSQAWPNLSVGPAIEYRRDSLPTGDVFSYGSGGPSYGRVAGKRFSQAEIGIAFRLTLPLYNRNDGGIKTANADLDAARTDLRLLESRIREEREAYSDSYGRLVKLLTDSGNELEAQERRHAQLESDMYRGTIDPALIIELHRELLDTIKQRNEAEHRARILLLRIRFLQGRQISKGLIDESFNDK